MHRILRKLKTVSNANKASPSISKTKSLHWFFLSSHRIGHCNSKIKHEAVLRNNDGVGLPHIGNIPATCQSCLPGLGYSCDRMNLKRCHAKFRCAINFNTFPLPAQLTSFSSVCVKISLQETWVPFRLANIYRQLPGAVHILRLVGYLPLGIFTRFTIHCSHEYLLSDIWKTVSGYLAAECLETVLYQSSSVRAWTYNVLHRNPV